MCPAAQTDFIKNDDDIYVVWYVLLDEFLTLRWCIGLVVYLLSQQVTTGCVRGAQNSPWVGFVAWSPLLF